MEILYIKVSGTEIPPVNQRVTAYSTAYSWNEDEPILVYHDGVGWMEDGDILERYMGILILKLTTGSNPSHRKSWRLSLRSG